MEIERAFLANLITGGLKEAKKVKEIIEKLKEMSKQISTKEEIAQVASISANDEEIGNVIAEIMDEVGKDGVITVEEGTNFGIEKETAEGMKFNKGYISPYMITNGEKSSAEYKDISVLITDKKISANGEIAPILEKLIQTGKKELLIIAEDVEAEALATLVVNKMRGTFNSIAVKSPGFGDGKKAILEDIAILTGGKVISEEIGLKLVNTEIEDLGTVSKVISTKIETTIVGGNSAEGAIEARINIIKKEMENLDGEYEKKGLAERIAKLAGGIGIIKVGAATEIEMKEKKDRIEDALNATKAAVEEGVVVGGGVALALAGKEGEEESNNIVSKAILEPIKQIASNAGQDGSLVLYNILNHPEIPNYGYNAATDTFEDLMAAGVVDPVKVVRSALENAASSAILFLTTEAVVSIKPEDKKDDMAGGMGMM